jgi:hypothetical protein
MCKLPHKHSFAKNPLIHHTDLSIAVTVKGLSQQIHILFVLVVVAALVFFVYCSTRLIAVILHRRKHPHAHRPHIPSIAGPEGFKPDIAIPVQLARDDEAMSDEEGKLPEEKAEALKCPPPAYGLWRGSVRLDPNLLHWQRVEEREQRERASSPFGSRDGSPKLSQRSGSPQASPQLGNVVEEPVRRPPSYVSEDGVSYVVSALPPAPPSDIHPAFRIRL